MKFFFVIYFFLFLFLHFANAQEAVPENFVCEVRYHFLGFHPFEQHPSYNGISNEYLPPSKIVYCSDGFKTRVIQGKVDSLPFLFTIEMKRKTKTNQSIAEIDIVNLSTSKSLNGFPKKRVIPSEQALKNAEIKEKFKIQKSLQNQLVSSYFKFFNYPPPDGRLVKIELVFMAVEPVPNEILEKKDLKQ